MDHSIARSVGFTGNEQFPWQVPFNLQDRPSFAWRTEGTKTRRKVRKKCRLTTDDTDGHGFKQYP
jgi:hypothetical protein